MVVPRRWGPSQTFKKHCAGLGPRLVIPAERKHVVTAFVILLRLTANRARLRNRPEAIGSVPRRCIQAHETRATLLPTRASTGAVATENLKPPSAWDNF